MALINCPDCGTSVSDRAAACVKCGAPIAAQANPAAADFGSPRVQTIEQTGKGYKAQQALGVVATMTGIVMMVAGETGSSANVFGAIVAGIGLIVYLSARLGAWWNHE